MDTTTPTDAQEVRAALAELQGHQAWALLRLSRKDPGEPDVVTFVGGDRSEVESLLDVPLEEGPPEPGRQFDRLLAVPFRQVRERGFEAHDDGAPLVVVDIATERRRRRGVRAGDEGGPGRRPGRRGRPRPGRPRGARCR